MLAVIIFFWWGDGLVQTDTIKIKAGPWDMGPASRCSLKMCYFSGVLISNVCTATPTFDARTSDVGVCEATGRRRSSSLWFHLLKAILHFSLEILPNMGKCMDLWRNHLEMMKDFHFLISSAIACRPPPPTNWTPWKQVEIFLVCLFGCGFPFLFFILKNTVSLLKGRAAPSFNRAD